MYVVGRIKLPYNPNRLFSRKDYKRARYAKIASEEGKKKALEVLEKDYRDGLLPYTTYRDIKKFLINDVEEVEPDEESNKIKLLEILEYVVSNKTTKIKDICVGLNMNEKEVLDVLRWGEKNYRNLVRVVYRYAKSKTTSR